MRRKTISVSEEVWRRLHELRLRLGVRSLNEVLTYILGQLERGELVLTEPPRTVEERASRCADFILKLGSRFGKSIRVEIAELRAAGFSESEIERAKEMLRERGYLVRSERNFIYVMRPCSSSTDTGTRDAEVDA